MQMQLIKIKTNQPSIENSWVKYSLNVVTVE